MNRQVYRDGKQVNLIRHLKNKKLIEGSIDELINQNEYNLKNQNLATRARAYLDINCAHCHSPGGLASYKSLNLSYDTPFHKTGIQFKGIKILQRMQVEGELHMPKLGTSISHKEGILLLTKYIESLQ